MGAAYMNIFKSSLIVGLVLGGSNFSVFAQAQDKTTAEELNFISQLGSEDPDSNVYITQRNILDMKTTLSKEGQEALLKRIRAHEFPAEARLEHSAIKLLIRTGNT